MIVICLKEHLQNLLPKKIVYKDYKNFNKNAFFSDLHQNLIQGKVCNQKHSNDLFTETFKSVRKLLAVIMPVLWLNTLEEGYY